MFVTAGSAIRLACRRRQFVPAVVFVPVVLLSVGVSDATARECRAGVSTTPVRVHELPPQAANTLLRVERGGPFPCSKDGVVVFGNRERLLPNHPRGFYRAHAVKTVGERDRGARRIVCGDREVMVPEACFYSDDHDTGSCRLVAGSPGTTLFI